MVYRFSLLLINGASSGGIIWRHLVGHHNAKQLDPSPAGLGVWVGVAEVVVDYPVLCVCVGGGSETVSK